MSKYLLYSSGLLLIVALSGCANAVCPTCCPATPGGALNGKMAPDYQGFLTASPARDPNSAYMVSGVGPDTYATYSSTRERDLVFPEQVALRGGRNGAVATYGPGFGHSVARPNAGIRGRRAGYAGIDPYANNPYAGNTVTRGPRDFLMTNPPNIGQ